MIDLSKIKVGDNLFVVSNSKFARSESVVVTKVGRKYIYLEGYRAPVEKENGKSWHGEYTSSAYSNGHGFHVYLDEADYELERREQKARKLFEETLHCSYQISNHLPIDKINRINAILSE